MKSSRCVRQLLIKGASRDIKDTLGRRPVDLAETISHGNLQRQVRQMLKPVKMWECLMLKTPMMKMKRSNRTLLFYVLINLFTVSILTFVVFPCKLIIA